MKKKLKVIRDKNGKCYTPSTASVMSQLVQLIDGIQYTTFEGDNMWYISFDVQIKWMQEEMKISPSQKEDFEKAINRMIEIQNSTS